jgi:hypothetical protein
MRKLKQLCIATVLTLALSFTAFAGIMDTPGVTAPPPPPNQTKATSNTETSDVTTSETSNSETEATDSMSELALYLFDSMISSIF